MGGRGGACRQKFRHRRATGKLTPARLGSAINAHRRTLVLERAESLLRTKTSLHLVSATFSRGRVVLLYLQTFNLAQRLICGYYTEELKRCL